MDGKGKQASTMHLLIFQLVHRCIHNNKQLNSLALSFRLDLAPVHHSSMVEPARRAVFNDKIYIRLMCHIYEVRNYMCSEIMLLTLDIHISLNFLPARLFAVCRCRCCRLCVCARARKELDLNSVLHYGSSFAHTLLRTR